MCRSPFLHDAAVAPAAGRDANGGDGRADNAGPPICGGTPLPAAWRGAGCLSPGPRPPQLPGNHALPGLEGRPDPNSPVVSATAGPPC